MKNVTHPVLFLTIVLAGAELWPISRAMAASDEARVTRIVHDVKLLPSDGKAKPAALDDRVSDGTGVRTGTASRSELTFVDLTIERLGSNTVFSFNRSGRSVHLDNGSMLLRVPKDSGGANMSTAAVSVSVTGTTVILESARGGRNKLTVLEGGARISLNKNRSESVYVRGGQMEDVPAGATKLPPPVNVNLSDIMKKNPLITDFGPLPSRDLIMTTASNPAAPQGAPADGEPARPGAVFPSIIPSIIGVGLGPILGGGGGHQSSSHSNRNTNTHTNRNTNTKSPGSTHTGTKGTGDSVKGDRTHSGKSPSSSRASARPTDTPSRKKKPAKPSVTY